MEDLQTSDPAPTKASRPFPTSNDAVTPSEKVEGVGAQVCKALKGLLDADLGFHGADGRYATHAWHPFPAKFPPQLPAFFIEALTEEGDVVFDPMHGSGTTLVEAQRLARYPVGCDIDPLARLITSAKLAPLPGLEAMEVGRGIAESAAQRFQEGKEGLVAALERRFDAKSRDFVDYWFAPDTQLELLALLEEVEALADPTARRFFEVVFSSTIIAKSGGVSLARDLAHTRPHRAKDKQPKSAFIEFDKRLRNNLVDRSDARRGEHELRAEPAQRTGLDDGSVDLVVTSPPYANNAIDYMRAHKFSLVWLGWPIGDLTDIRKGYLGHDAKGGVIPAAGGMETNADVDRVQDFRWQGELPPRCVSTLGALRAVDARKADVLQRYFMDMASVFQEMARVLRRGKTAIVVVGSSVLRGIDVETHKALAAIGEAVGFTLAGIGTRELDRDKRMMPARWGKTRASRIEERMHQEFVIGLVKP